MFLKVKSILILSMVFFWCGLCLAQDTETLPEVSFEVEVAQRWHEQATGEGEADSRLNSLEAIRSETSAEVFELASLLYLAEGNRLLKDAKTLGSGSQAQASYDRANESFHNAIRLNEYLWPAYDGLGAVKRGKGEGLLSYLQLSFKGMRLAFDSNNAWFTLDVLYWLCELLQKALLVLLIVFAFLLCGKYARQFFLSTLNSLSERHFHELYASLLAIGLLVLPFLLGLNLYLCAGLSLVLFLPFFDPRERIASLVLMGTPLLLPFLSFVSDNVAHARTDKSLEAHLTQYVRGDVSQQMAFLSKNPGYGEMRQLTTLIMGLLQKNKGSLREAVATFESIPRDSPWYAHARINLGNLHVQAKEYQEASDLYKSVEANPKLGALATYNQAVVKGMQGLYTEAEGLRSSAFNRNEGLSKRYDSEGVSRVWDALPDNQARLMQAIWPGIRDTANDRLSHYFIEALSLSGILYLLGLIHLRVRNTRLLAKICDKCGRIFFPSDSPQSEWCSQCVTLYIKKEDLPTEAKLRKYDEVARFSRRRRYLLMLLQLVLPGAKRLVTGNAINGLITLALWVVLILLNLKPITTLGYSGINYLQTPVLLSWMIGVTSVVYWLIFGLRPALRED